jgi:predicted nucleic acid-binding protein
LTGATLIDAGPLVAFLNGGDAFHEWAKARLGEIQPPLLTAESVLAEAWHLLHRTADGQAGLLDLVQRDSVRVAFDLHQHIVAIQRLTRRYASVPMSLADASLVRMSELFADSRLMTMDSDFRIYRRNGRQAIALIFPDD